MPSKWNYKTGRYEKISSKKRFTDKQRAAYWKRKYLALRKSRSR